MILLSSINIPQTLDILDKHLLSSTAFSTKKYYLLWQLCHTHIFDLNRRAILSLTDTVCYENSLSVVEFITVADNGRMPDSIDLTSDELGRKTPCKTLRQIVDVQ